MSSQRAIVALILVSTVITAMDLLHEKPLKLKSQMRRMENCPEYPELPHYYKDIRIELDPETEILYISGTLNATEPMEEGSTGLLKIFRCFNDDDNSCEKSIEIDIDDLCKHLPEMNKSWSPIIENLKGFDPHCPTPAGVYELFDAPIPTKNMKKSYAMVGHWQGEMVVTNKEGRMIACMQGDSVISVDND